MSTEIAVRLSQELIEFVDRQRGTSKMSFHIIVEALLLVTWWGIRDRVARRKPHRRFRLHLAAHRPPGDERSSGSRVA